MNDNVEKLMLRFCRGGYTEGLRKCSHALKQNKATVVMTPNAEMLARASKEKELARILSGGDILFPDGVGVFFGMKRIGAPIFEKSCGIELCTRLFSGLSAQKKRARVFLLGGSPGVAEKAAKNLSANYGGVYICGTHHGFFDSGGKANDAIVEQINESRAEILLVCMGFPRQEKWMLDNRHRLTSVRLMMGLGGSLDVWSGNIPRAPKVVRDIGFEWAYRVIAEPSRISRLPYLAEFAAELALPQRFKHR